MLVPLKVTQRTNRTRPTTLARKKILRCRESVKSNHGTTVAGYALFDAMSEPTEYQPATVDNNWHNDYAKEQAKKLIARRLNEPKPSPEEVTRQYRMLELQHQKSRPTYSTPEQVEKFYAAQTLNKDFLRSLAIRKSRGLLILSESEKQLLLDIWRLDQPWREHKDFEILAQAIADL